MPTPVSVNTLCNALSDSHDARQLQKLLQSVLTDLTALRSAHVTLAAKLDLDDGVIDQNYGALTNPAALNTKT